MNRRQIERTVARLERELSGLRGRTVAVLGLAFKANTDDVRYSPALEVVQAILNEGADVHASDPVAIARAQAVLPDVSYHQDPYAALRGAEAALVCTEWDHYRNLDWERAGSLMARRLVIDGRNLYSPERMRDLGFEYFSFGRESVQTARMEAVR